ncbi:MULTISPECIES: hypothetical protein [unclassified Microcoleus]|uniref:hypothetical protein n=1 Tax=unclassified Microcoleus TaxID=2642155 RepID=UPI002FCF88C4
MNRQDACSTRKFIFCGTGILPVLENGATSQFTLTSLLTPGKIPNGLTQAPVCGYALKLEVALLVEEVARVAQKSSCTAQSCW